MKLLKVVSCGLLAAVLGLSVVGCAPTAKKEGTGGYIDDTVITTKVKAKLLAEKNLNSTEIKVETFKGKVQLSGFVNSQATAARAVEVTRHVPGVRVVVDTMQLK